MNQSINSQEFDYMIENQRDFLRNETQKLDILFLKENRQLTKKFNSREITRSEFNNLKQILNNNYRERKIDINRKGMMFQNAYYEYRDSCNFNNVRNSIKDNNYNLFGLWHLDFINNQEIESNEVNIALIDGFLSSNKLMNNFKMKTCDNNEKCIDYINVVNEDNIFKGNNNHSYWIASLIAGNNCGNENSEFQQVGVNNQAKIIPVNISKLENEEKDYHSINYMIKAFQEINKREDIRVVYTPISFTIYTEQQKEELSKEIKEFTSQNNKNTVIGVFGNRGRLVENKLPVPCIIEHVLCIGGVNEVNMLSTLSYNNENIDLYAPSVNLIAGINRRNERIRENGVSGAGAIVAGMISKLIKDRTSEEAIEKITINGRFLILDNGELDTERKSVRF